MSGHRSISAEVAIIGAGPAGLACAQALKKAGLRDIVILEREAEAGGIPRHCGHTGYGLAEFSRLMTGPGYARRLVDGVAGLDLRTKTTVLRLEPNGVLQITDRDGPATLSARAVLLALGARETPRSARLLTGARPWGVMNTGMLQQMIYLQNRKPFERPVVIGTELVSFSTLLTLRHAGIKPVALIEPCHRITARRPADLITRFCFRVPVLLNTKLHRILGTERVEGIEIDRGNGIERIDCDGVILTGQFRPETALVVPSHLALDGVVNETGTGGPVIDQFMRCSDPSYFAAGNLLRGIETAGQCFREGRAAASNILETLRGNLPPAPAYIPVTHAEPVAYVYPQRIDPLGTTDQPLLFKFRAMRPARGRLQVSIDGKVVWSRCIQALPERRLAWHLPARLLTGAQNVHVEITGEKPSPAR
ncbi:NAD(P)/FAD-dependent oxidoreductase [Dongia soli]|uniref:FAD/NAD(P)-binding oxidoreductase n=1 Tax=Dongia soli TaxID=600628 RepID=A0ABU5EE45_9PROT|nr:FAD/NAD(P)-binding oxidoreductase [Dongia soli]MDY0883805.1 FAD/NAD(P)-binding oxidoreductase [Dongia soli]